MQRPWIHPLSTEENKTHFLSVSVSPDPAPRFLSLFSLQWAFELSPPVLWCLPSHGAEPREPPSHAHSNCPHPDRCRVAGLPVPQRVSRPLPGLASVPVPPKTFQGLEFCPHPSVLGSLLVFFLLLTNFRLLVGPCFHRASITLWFSFCNALPLLCSGTSPFLPWNRLSTRAPW